MRTATGIVTQVGIMPTTATFDIVRGELAIGPPSVPVTRLHNWVRFDPAGWREMHPMVESQEDYSRLMWNPDLQTARVQAFSESGMRDGSYDDGD